MSAHTDVVTLSGATLSISATLPPTYDAAGYDSTDVLFTEVGQVEDHGAHGVKAAISKFTPVATAVVAKVKGSKDYGTKSIKLGNVAGDAGQIIMKAASESNNHYSIKIAYPDGEKHFLDVLVSEYSYTDGTVDSVRTIAAMLEVCRQPVIVAAA